MDDAAWVTNDRLNAIDELVEEGLLQLDELHALNAILLALIGAIYAGDLGELLERMTPIVAGMRDRTAPRG